jgi:uncharacterized protein YndB with AHSA1/START domain
MPRFEQDIKVDAPVDKVWTMLMNPGSWGLWFPNADSVSGLASVSPGASFTFRQGNDEGSAQIVEVDEGRGLIKIVTMDDGKQVSHTIDLDRAGGFLGMGGNDTRVIYTREFDAPGGFMGEFVSGGNPADTLAVKGVLERIKRAIEG